MTNVGKHATGGKLRETWMREKGEAETVIGVKLGNQKQNWVNRKRSEHYWTLLAFRLAWLVSLVSPLLSG